MKLNIKSSINSLLIALFVLVAGGLYADTCESPDVLRFAEIVRPDNIDNRGFKKQSEIFRDILARETGKTVELIFTKSYADSSMLLQKGSVELARIGPNTYVQSKIQNADIEAFATAVNLQSERSKEAGYNSLLVIRDNGKFDSIASLKNSRLALVDPGSTSGFLVPKILFSDFLGVPLEQYFNRVLISGDQILSFKALASGRVDAAFLSSSLLNVVVEDGIVSMDDYTVLWTSPSIPREPFVYRQNLCDDLKEVISSTLFEIHKNPKSSNWLKRLHASKLVAVEDEDFDIIRQLLLRKKDHQ